VRAPPHPTEDTVLHIGPAHTQLLEGLGGQPALHVEQAEQEVLGADVVVLQALGGVLGPL
jgi:hypothetical protein